MSKIYFSLAFLCFFLIACSSKQYYTPESIDAEISPLRAQYSLLKQTSAGATLEQGKFITPLGISEQSIPKECTYINQDETFILAFCAHQTTKIEHLLVKNKNDYTEKYFEYDYKPISASINKNTLAVVLADNSFVIQDFNSRKILMHQKESSIDSINFMHANPYFLRDLIILPMMNGSLFIVDRTRLQIVRKIAISNARHFNNISFLDVFNNRLIAASKFRVVSISPEFISTQDINLRDIIVLRDRIYLLSAEGEVIWCDYDLNIIKRIKFPFAHFLTASIKDELVVLEKRGYIIAIEPDLSSYKVYKLTRDIEYPMYANGEAIYFGNFYIQIK